jgi:hypothetical protein
VKRNDIKKGGETGFARALRNREGARTGERYLDREERLEGLMRSG